MAWGRKTGGRKPRTERSMEAIMIKQPPTLEQRIFDALQPDAAVISADVAALMEEAEIGIAKAEKERGRSDTGA